MNSDEGIVQIGTPLRPEASVVTPTALQRIQELIVANDWDKVLDTLTSQTRSLQQQYGRGCFHWLRAISTVRKHFQHLNIDVLVKAHALFKSALASLDVELTAYVDGNMRRQAQWRLLQSIFLKDLVTLEAQLYQYHARKASQQSSADDEASTSRVVDLDEDDAFGAGDNNLQRQKDLLLMNMTQAMQFIEGELRGVLQHFIGVDTHRIRHLLLPTTDGAAATSAPFSFPTLKIAPFDPMFLCERLPLLFAAASPQTSSPTPSRAAGIPIVTLPDLLSAYLTLHTGFLDLLRETGQVSLAIQMTQHVVLSLGTVVSFLSLINQAVRMPGQRVAAPDADDDGGDGDDDATSAPSAENAAECTRVLSVLLHALRRHRAVTAFKLTVLEQQLAQQAPREADAAADLSLFRPFEIDGYEEGQRRITGLGQSYIDLDSAIREHLRRATAAKRASPASGDWMARLTLTRALCGELAALHDWMHTRSIATPLTRELFAALEITPYNHAQSLFPARRPARSATEMRVSWVVTSDTDRVEVADTLLALYDLQSRACQHLLHPKNDALSGQSLEALRLEAVRGKYQAGLLALLWAANMPETARRLLESAEEAQRALRPLLRQRWQTAATVSRSAEADDVFESTLLCGDVSFHLGLAYFQGGSLQDAVDATQDALRCFDEAMALLQALGRAAPLGPCAPSAAADATNGDDVAQVQLRRRHCHSQLLWVYTALGSEVDARQALQALTSPQQDADETARLCVMIHQRLGVDVRSWLAAPAAVPVAATAATATIPPRIQAARPATTGSTASSTVTQRRPARTTDGASPAAATGSDRASSVPPPSSVAAETLSPLERQKKLDELEARLRRLEPLDGNFVASVAILSLVGLCVAYALLRFFGWDAALFGDAVDEGALFDL